VVDTPIIEQTQFGPDMERWLTTLVDIVNDNFLTLNQGLIDLIAAQGVTVTAGSGPGPYTVAVTGLTASGYVNATLISYTAVMPNITIVSVVPGLNSFQITFSADPTSAIIVYQAFISQPQ